MILAAYTSRCSCGKPIEEGDEIGKLDGEWVCAECVEEQGEDQSNDRRQQ